MAPERRNVEFKTVDGLTLRAWFFPAGAKGPCIIMAHGFGGLKEHFLSNFANRFQEEGWNVLVYDNRNFGESDGLPRLEIDPAFQVRDYYDAFDYAASLDEVDKTKIAFWGSSMSGGVALSAAAVDHRIRAVVAQVPFVSGALQSASFAPIIPGLFANRLAIKAGNSSAKIPIIASSLEEAQSGQSRAVLGQADAYEFMTKAVKQGGNWENHVTLQTMFHLLSFEPQATIHRIAPTPLLMVVADSDTCIPTADQLATYQKALEPKELHVLRNVGHFDVYDGPGFENNVKVQIDFLKKNL